MARTVYTAVDERIFQACTGDSVEPAYCMEPPTHRMQLTTEIVGGKDIGVGIVDARRLDAVGRPVGETIFVAMGYAAMLEPHAMARFEHMAAARNARIVVPEYPGVGMQASRVRFRLGLLFGSFKKTGRQMAKAAGRAASLARGETVTVMGYSQGAAACIEMAAIFDERGINVNRLRLVEPVNNQRHFLALGTRSGRENLRAQRYYNTNTAHGIPDPIDVRLKRDPKELIYQEWAHETGTHKDWRNSAIVRLGGVALVWNRLNGRLEKVLGHAQNGLQNAKVEIIQFDESILSRRKHNERTAKIADRAQEAARMRLGLVALRPPKAELLIITATGGLDHSAWHSVPLAGNWLTRYLLWHDPLSATA